MCSMYSLQLNCDQRNADVIAMMKFLWQSKGSVDKRLSLSPSEKSADLDLRTDLQGWRSELPEDGRTPHPRSSGPEDRITLPSSTFSVGRMKNPHLPSASSDPPTKPSHVLWGPDLRRRSKMLGFFEEPLPIFEESPHLRRTPPLHERTLHRSDGQKMVDLRSDLRGRRLKMQGDSSFFGAKHRRRRGCFVLKAEDWRQDICGRGSSIFEEVSIYSKKFTYL